MLGSDLLGSHVKNMRKKAYTAIYKKVNFSQTTQPLGSDVATTTHRFLAKKSITTQKVSVYAKLTVILMGLHVGIYG